MNIDKVSFLMYNSWQNAINSMPDDNAGRLLKRIYAFQVDGEDFLNDNTIEWYVFQTMKGQFLGDIKNYQKRCAKNSENAKKGAEGARERMKTNNPKKKTSNGMSRTSDGMSQTSDGMKKQAEEEEDEVEEEVEEEDEDEVEEEEAHEQVDEYGVAPEGAVNPQSALTSSENDIIDFILERVNKEGNQNFTMDNRLREQFWKMLCGIVDDPFNREELYSKIHLAWMNASNHITLLRYFKPFDIFREMLWEYN